MNSDDLHAELNQLENKLLKEKDDLPLEQQLAAGTVAKVEKKNAKEVDSYLDTLRNLFEKEEVSLVNPASFRNQEIYDALSEEEQGKVDQAMMVLLGDLRMIKQLMDLGQEDNAQAEQYVERIFQYKSKLESDLGKDVLKL